MKNESIYYFKKLKEKYLLLRSGEMAIFAIAGAMLVFGLTTFLNISPSLRLIAAIAGGIIVFSILFLRLKLYRFNNNRLVRFINHHFPVLEHSTDLLLKDEETLTSLQKLQREKVDRNFVDLVAGIKLPHQIGKAAIVLGASAMLTTAFFFLREKKILEEGHKTNETASSETGWSTQMPVSVEALTIQVSPPRYTGVANYTTEDPNLSIPEGSRVQWNILFSDSVGEPALVFPGRDSLKLSPNGKNYEGARSFSASNIYQLSWRSQGQGRISDYYKVEVIKDQPPRITLPQQAEYTQVSHEDDQTVPLRVSIADDYGLNDAYVVATVSKGSGESIKFREEKLPFTSPSKVNGRRAQLTRTIDLKALGLAPGDELYFYVEALDNKMPAANRARTQTYFISLRDTSSQKLSVEAGLGVDLMPAYFRSQRQIIIDSEKLLRDRKTISQETFNSRSNEIGYDQKVLRLKYGEFLGEEFETNIGPGGEPQESEEEEEHHHNEGGEDDHSEGEEEDPIAAYKHVHDDPEEATFFTQSIRSKLKAALSAMWDSELHLRTFDPKTSLPYQYVALRLLKEISQDSRIYVHKTGFDPPPIKEEKRLTGDLSEINNSTTGLRAHEEISYPGIRSALDITEEWMARPESSLTKHRKDVFLLAGQELATLALNQPGGNYLRALSVIKSLSEEEIPSQEVANNLLFLRKVFWNVLPKEMAAPDKPVYGLHGLDRAFIDHLKGANDE